MSTSVYGSVKVSSDIYDKNAEALITPEMKRNGSHYTPAVIYQSSDDELSEVEDSENDIPPVPTEYILSADAPAPTIKNSYSIKDSAKRFRSAEHTQQQLGQLIRSLKDENEDYAYKLRLTRKSALPLSAVLILIIALVAGMALMEFKPYCAPVRTDFHNPEHWSLLRALFAWSPCVPCPKDAECDVFFVKKCNNNKLLINDRICVAPIDESNAKEAYNLSRKIKSMAETTAWSGDCLLMNRNPRELDVTSVTANNNKAVVDLAKQMMKENTDLYQIRFVSNNTIKSTRYEKGGLVACYTDLKQLYLYGRQRITKVLDFVTEEFKPTFKQQ